MRAPDLAAVAVRAVEDFPVAALVVAAAMPSERHAFVLDPDSGFVLLLAG